MVAVKTRHAELNYVEIELRVHFPHRCFNCSNLKSAQRKVEKKRFLRDLGSREKWPGFEIFFSEFESDIGEEY
jgi:hypothetical protein